MSGASLCGNNNHICGKAKEIEAIIHKERNGQSKCRCKRRYHKRIHRFINNGANILIADFICDFSDIGAYMYSVKDNTRC